MMSPARSKQVGTGSPEADQQVSSSAKCRSTFHHIHFYIINPMYQIVRLLSLSPLPAFHTLLLFLKHLAHSSSHIASATGADDLDVKDEPLICLDVREAYLLV